MKHSAFIPVEESGRREVEPSFEIDFRDVFGGPPRMLFLRQQQSYSTFGHPFLFYDQVFDADELDGRRIVTDPTVSERRRSRNLPAFVIPGSRGGSALPDQGFYDAVFSLDGKDTEDGVSGLRSRSTSERASPHRPSVHGDMALSALASRLKPIIVRSQNSERLPNDGSCLEHIMHGKLIEASTSSCMEFTDHQSMDGCKENSCSGKFDKQNLNFSSQPVHEQLPQYNQAMKSPYDKFYYNPETNYSPSSVTISLAQDPESCMEMSDKGFRDDEGEPEIMGNYVIGIVPEKRDETDVEDVIAWVKENRRTGGVKTSDCGQISERRNSKSGWNLRCEKHELNPFAEPEILYSSS